MIGTFHRRHCCNTKIDRRKR